MYPKKIFIIKLRQHLCQLIDLDALSPNNSKIQLKTYLQIDLITASIIAILCSHGTEIGLPLRSQKTGIQTYQNIAKFIKIHRVFLQELLPSIKTISLYRTSIEYYLLDKFDLNGLNKFADVFVEWTLEVSKCYSQIKPCTREDVIAAYESDSKRPLIMAVYQWKNCNPKIERMVDEIFTFNKKVDTQKINENKKQELEEKIKQYVELTVEDIEDSELTIKNVENLETRVFALLI